MHREDRQRVSSVIQDHTQKVTLEQLAKRGNRHVRVISGEKTLKLIEAIVDEAIAHRAGQIADRDRDRIVKEAEHRFQQISRIQAEADGLIGQQKGIIEQQGKEVAALRQRDRELVAALRRREHRLTNMRRTILSYDAEIDRLAKQVKDDAALIERLQGEPAEREALAVRLEAIETLLGTLTESSAKRGEDLEGRFRSSMDEALEKVRTTLHAAVARPVDRAVEATDVVVAQIFDDEHEMESNLERLDVQVSTTKEGIAASLDRLKQLREQALIDEEEPGESETAAP